LRAFGSLKKVRQASVEELSRAPGMTLAAAEAVVRYFRGDPIVEPDPPAERQREDVAEAAAEAELDELASEEEAAELTESAELPVEPADPDDPDG
jgi:hypothetical protein